MEIELFVQFQFKDIFHVSATSNPNALAARVGRRNFPVFKKRGNKECDTVELRTGTCASTGTSTSVQVLYCFKIVYTTTLNEDSILFEDY
jgi:hypothetical protein